MTTDSTGPGCCWAVGVAAGSTAASTCIVGPSRSSFFRAAIALPWHSSFRGIPATTTEHACRPPDALVPLFPALHRSWQHHCPPGRLESGIQVVGHGVEREAGGLLRLKATRRARPPQDLSLDWDRRPRRGTAYAPDSMCLSAGPDIRLSVFLMCFTF